MTYTVFDIEADGLLDTVSKIYCLSYQVLSDKFITIEKGTITSKEDYVNFFNRDTTFVCHNAILFDKRVLKKLLGIDIGKLIDTITISWYLLPEQAKHGLEYYGIKYGVLKKEVKDWVNLSLEIYIERCETDVEINTILFVKQMRVLSILYDKEVTRNKLLNYLYFKLDCISKQLEHGLTLDIFKTKKYIETLESTFDNYKNDLSKVMPTNKVFTVMKKPKNIFKKDGNLTVNAERWFKLLADNNLQGDVVSMKVATKEEPGNPGSAIQLKNWLYDLGWIPDTFKANDKGEEVPQISLPFGAGLTKSVKDLINKEPHIKHLETYYKVRHRLGVFKAFLKSETNEEIHSDIAGFTNTLRFKHKKPIANLPKPSVFWGKEIREVITAGYDRIMCGSDLSSIEDSTKQHYIFKHDPQYVKDMRVEGFDPHLDIGIEANLLTKEESEFYKNAIKENFDENMANKYAEISKKRFAAKTVNFSATYGAGAAKIAKTLNRDIAFATNLHKAYWKRNSAIKEIVKSVVLKNIGKAKFLYNPVSGFWLYLKDEKDIFSTLNQSTAVFVFDVWLNNIRKLLEQREIYVRLQYHDELLIICEKSEKDFVEQSIKKAMELTNEQLQLNVEINCSIDWGVNYAECH